jgi:hypothetical protein
MIANSYIMRMHESQTPVDIYGCSAAATATRSRDVTRLVALNSDQAETLILCDASSPHSAQCGS